MRKLTIFGKVIQKRYLVFMTDFPWCCSAATWIRLFIVFFYEAKGHACPRDWASPKREVFISCVSLAGIWALPAEGGRVAMCVRTGKNSQTTKYSHRGNSFETITQFHMIQENGRHPQFHRTAKQAPEETYLEWLKISELQKSSELETEAGWDHVAKNSSFCRTCAIFWCYRNKNQKQRRLIVKCIKSQRIH